MSQNRGTKRKISLDIARNQDECFRSLIERLQKVIRTVNDKINRRCDIDIVLAKSIIIRAKTCITGLERDNGSAEYASGLTAENAIDLTANDDDKEVWTDYDEDLWYDCIDYRVIVQDKSV